MKRRNILKDDEAVSPVIATILMVAITVVLAATLYMMLPRGGDTSTPVAGDLSYRSTRSSPSTGDASFDITLQTPGSAAEGDVTVTVLDDGGTEVTNYTATWSLLDDGEIVSGSRLGIDFDEEFDIDDYEVVIRIDGYSGTITETVG